MSYIGTNKIGGMYLGSTEIAKAYLGDTLVYEKESAVEPIPDHACVIFRSTKSNTISMTCNGSAAPVLYVSTDGTTWAQWDYSALTISSGHPVFMYGSNSSSFSSSSSNYAQFVTGGTGKISCSGDLMTFVDGAGTTKTIPRSHYFYNLFRGCTHLTDAPTISATTVQANCYYGMFYGCTSLVTAPELVATTLANYCYCYMFRECSSLVNAPTISATTLKNNCCNSMFYSCTSLEKAPVLLATTLVSGCYAQMFRYCSKLNYIKAMFTTTPSSSYTSSWVQGVASSGTFVKNSSATWSVSGNNGVPSNWTIQTASS